MDPDGDVGAAVVAGLAKGINVITTCRHLIDEVLNDTGRHHGERRKCKSSSDLLDGREVDTSLAQTRVNKEVHDWDEDNDEDGVQLRDDIVRCLSEVHGVGLRHKIVGHLQSLAQDTC